MLGSLPIPKFASEGPQTSANFGIGTLAMLAQLKAWWRQLAGADGKDAPAAEPGPAVEYKGYRIRAAPYKAGSVYQTAGIIEKDSAAGVKEHRFVRADTHHGKEDAVAFAISKAKQIIDLQGDRMFDERRTEDDGREKPSPSS